MRSVDELVIPEGDISTAPSTGETPHRHRPRILFVLGTRPEAIKLAPVILRFQHSGQFDVRVCSTGQHREMLEQALEHFAVTPDYHLAVMTHDQSLAGLSARALHALDAALEESQPDCVFVQGDTTTAMVAALAAFYRRLPVAHVEAGLRTNDKYSPFPEEINRRLIGSMADLHFAPTEAARSNLLREGTADASIFVTGNTAIDALLLTIERHRAEELEIRDLHGECIPERDLRGKRLVLVTAHRRENHETGLRTICAAIEAISTFPDAAVVFAVHRNPKVRATVLPALDGCPAVHLTDPLDYLTFTRLMDRAFIILTDSGGIQEEAPALGKPVLVMRDTTERPEAIAAGNALLVGCDTAPIVEAARELWTDPARYREMATARNPFGDGTAAEQILHATARYLEGTAMSRKRRDATATATSHEVR